MTLAEILTSIKNLCTISGTGQDTFLTQEVNNGQQDFTREINMPYTESRGSLAVVAYQQVYTVASDVDVIQSVTYHQKHKLYPVNYNKWIDLNVSESLGMPRYWIMHEGKLKIYPPEDTTAPTTTLNGGINDSVATITLTSVANLKSRGRGLIDTEVVGWEYVDGTNKQIKLCGRGLEGTTAAAHLTGATFTYQEIEYTYFKNLDDLSGTDISTIPLRYHEALVLYGAARWFLKNENINMHDSLMGKYELVKLQAKGDLGEKQAQFFTTTLDDTISKFEGRDNTCPPDSSLS